MVADLNTTPASPVELRDVRLTDPMEQSPRSRNSNDEAKIVRLFDVNDDQRDASSASSSTPRSSASKRPSVPGSPATTSERPAKKSSHSKSQQKKQPVFSPLAVAVMKALQGEISTLCWSAARLDYYYALRKMPFVQATAHFMSHVPSIDWAFPTLQDSSEIRTKVARHLDKTELSTESYDLSEFFRMKFKVSHIMNCFRIFFHFPFIFEAALPRYSSRSTGCSQCWIRKCSPPLCTSYQRILSC